MRPLTTPELQKAEARLSELQTEEAAVEIECSAASAELDRAIHGERLTADQKAALLLAGEVIPVRMPIPQLEAQLIALRDRRKTLESAVRLQREAVTSLRVRLTRANLADLEKEHDAILREQLAAGMAMFRARKASRVWRAQAEAQGWAVASCGELSGDACYPHGLRRLIETMGKRGIIARAEADRLLSEVSPELPMMGEGASAGSRHDGGAMHQAALVGAANTGIVLGGGR